MEKQLGEAHIPARERLRAGISHGGRTLGAQSVSPLFHSGPGRNFGLSCSQVALHSRNSKIGCGRMMRRTSGAGGLKGDWRSAVLS